MTPAALLAPIPKSNPASASGPTNSAASPPSLNNWGQININSQSVGAKAKGADNNWGQININFFVIHSDLCAKKINVDLTPFIEPP
jgi:hypothetical protein